MPLDRADVEAALEKKGFQIENRDHRYFTYYTSQGKKTQIKTRTSHGTNYKKLGDDLVKAMSKQCGLTMPQFKDFVSCELSRDDYQAVLVSAGKVTLDPLAPNEQT